MNTQDLNVVLAIAVVMAGALSLAAWVSPRALDWLVLRLHARSVALTAARRAYAQAWADARRSATEEAAQ